MLFKWIFCSLPNKEEKEAQREREESEACNDEGSSGTLLKIQSGQEIPSRNKSLVISAFFRIVLHWSYSETMSILILASVVVSTIGRRRLEVIFAIEEVFKACTLRSDFVLRIIRLIV